MVRCVSSRSRRIRSRGGSRASIRRIRATMAAGGASEQGDYVIMGHVLQVGGGQITARHGAPAGRAPRSRIGVAALRLTIRTKSGHRLLNFVSAWAWARDPCAPSHPDTNRGSHGLTSSRHCGHPVTTRPAWRLPVFFVFSLDSGSDIEDEARGAGTGDANHHATAGLPLVLVKDRVAVVGDAFEYGCLARAAGAFGAGGEHADAGLLDDGQDGRVRRDGEGEVALREVDLECLGQHRLAKGLGSEALDVQGSPGPGGAALLHRSEQGFGTAAIHLGLGLRLTEQAVKVEEARLVLRPYRHLVTVPREFV